MSRVHCRDNSAEGGDVAFLDPEFMPGRLMAHGSGVCDCSTGELICKGRKKTDLPLGLVEWPKACKEFTEKKELILPPPNI